QVVDELFGLERGDAGDVGDLERGEAGDADAGVGAGHHADEAQPGVQVHAGADVAVDDVVEVHEVAVGEVAVVGGAEHVDVALLEDLGADDAVGVGGGGFGALVRGLEDGAQRVGDGLGDVGGELGDGGDAAVSGVFEGDEVVDLVLVVGVLLHGGLGHGSGGGGVRHVRRSLRW